MLKQFNLLLAENDTDLAIITKNFLSTNGYKTKVCDTENGLWLNLSKEKNDFLIIDTSVLRTDGLSFVLKIRKTYKDIPIILIGANVSQTDIITGFQMGVDDFVTRPFSMEELALRIEAIMRRIRAAEQGQYLFKIGKFTLDSLHHLLIINGKEKKLTAKELDLLLLFYEYRNRIVERHLALKKVWNQENYFSARNMDVYIKRIRALLADDPDVALKNIHGVGYKLMIRGL